MDEVRERENGRGEGARARERKRRRGAGCGARDRRTADLPPFSLTSRPARTPSPPLSLPSPSRPHQIYKTLENKVDALLEAGRSKKAALASKASSDPKCVPRLKRPWHGPSVLMADSTWMVPFYAGVAQALLERGVITPGWTPFGGAGGGAVTAVSDVFEGEQGGETPRTRAHRSRHHQTPVAPSSHVPLSVSPVFTRTHQVLTNAGYDGYAQLGLASQITAAMCPASGNGTCDTTAFTAIATGVWGAALPANVGYLRELDLRGRCGGRRLWGARRKGERGAATPSAPLHDPSTPPTPRSPLSPPFPRSPSSSPLPKKWATARTSGCPPGRGPPPPSRPPSPTTSPPSRPRTMCSWPCWAPPSCPASPTRSCTRRCR